MKRMRSKYNGTIMANDPSMTAWGWAVLDYKGYVLKTGCIKTAKEAKKLRIRVGDDNSRRVCEIQTKLKEVIDQYNVKMLLGELPYGYKSAGSSFSAGIALATLEAIKLFADIPLEWYLEADAKKAVLGRRDASKQEVINAVDKLYIVEWSNIQYIDEAVADALAIYRVAEQQSSMIKMLRR